MDVLDAFEFPEGNDAALLEKAVLKMTDVFSKATFDVLSDDEPPSIPSEGLSPEKIEDFEKQVGCQFPEGLRMLYSRYRYLSFSDSFKVFGVHSPEEVGYGSPWISDQHEKGRDWLVLGQYWRHADGDDLLMDLQSGEVYAYLHEYRGKIEWYAPSIAAAVFRSVFEVSDEEYAELYEFEG